MIKFLAVLVVGAIMWIWVKNWMKKQKVKKVSSLIKFFEKFNYDGETSYIKILCKNGSVFCCETVPCGVINHAQYRDKFENAVLIKVNKNSKIKEAVIVVTENGKNELQVPGGYAFYTIEDILFLTKEEKKEYLGE